MARIPGALRALLSNLIDYAGLFPPAALPLSAVFERYCAFLESPDSWMLNRLVLPHDLLGQVRLHPDWRVTLLVEREPGPLPRQVETLETRLSYRLSLPTYCEVPLADLGAAFAKLRTGGVTPAAIPSPSRVADFLCQAAAGGVAFKATAGLHHPIRSPRPLTYAPDSPRAIMHGFLNVFVAAAFAWQGMHRDVVLEILTDSDPGAFQFRDDELAWRASSVSRAQVEAARLHFAHSFGSCSFEEPISELRELGLCP
ncbi:MAG TPA: hypothetical protein VJ732_01625 [Bryobacteraceae bacterium]|nr:hypothetical protein [Bryobacteraceae bacterium]